MAHVIIHTQGVVLGDHYIPLELSYRDVLGFEKHFLINSPLNYSKIRRLYPSSRPDVIVTVTEGTPYSEVIAFLIERRQFLETLYQPCVFGYKGNGYQTKVLDDAAIENRLNLNMLPKLNYVGHCSWHKGKFSKCSRAALAQMMYHLTPPNVS